MNKIFEWIKCYQMPRYGNMYIRDGTMEQLKFLNILKFKHLDIDNNTHKIPPNAIVEHICQSPNKNISLSYYIPTNEEKQVFDNFLQNSKDTECLSIHLSDACNNDKSFSVDRYHFYTYKAFLEKKYPEYYESYREDASSKVKNDSG